MSKSCNRAFRCASRLVSSEMDPIDWHTALRHAIPGPHSHSAYSSYGDPLCPQGPYARHDTHVLLRNGQCPILRRLFPFLNSFFPLSPSLPPLSLSLSYLSPRAFSHEASFRLVLPPRGDPVSDALDASGSLDRLVPGSEKLSASTSRVKVTLAWARMKKRAMHVLAAANVYDADAIDTSLYSRLRTDSLCNRGWKHLSRAITLTNLFWNRVLTICMKVLLN